MALAGRAIVERVALALATVSGAAMASAAGAPAFLDVGGLSLCYPFFLILALLFAALYAQGKSPMAFFDISSPRRAGLRQYRVRTYQLTTGTARALRRMAKRAVGGLMSRAAHWASAKGSRYVYLKNSNDVKGVRMNKKGEVQIRDDKTGKWKTADLSKPEMKRISDSADNQRALNANLAKLKNDMKNTKWGSSERNALNKSIKQAKAERDSMGNAAFKATQSERRFAVGGSRDYKAESMAGGWRKIGRIGGGSLGMTKRGEHGLVTKTEAKIAKLGAFAASVRLGFSEAYKSSTSMLVPGGKKWEKIPIIGKQVSESRERMLLGASKKELADAAKEGHAPQISPTVEMRNRLNQDLRDSRAQYSAVANARNDSLSRLAAGSLYLSQLNASNKLHQIVGTTALGTAFTQSTLGAKGALWITAQVAGGVSQAAKLGVALHSPEYAQKLTNQATARYAPVTTALAKDISTMKSVGEAAKDPAAMARLTSGIKELENKLKDPSISAHDRSTHEKSLNQLHTQRGMAERISQGGATGIVAHETELKEKMTRLAAHNDMMTSFKSTIEQQSVKQKVRDAAKDARADERKDMTSGEKFVDSMKHGWEQVGKIAERAEERKGMTPGEKFVDTLTHTGIWKAGAGVANFYGTYYRDYYAPTFALRGGVVKDYQHAQDAKIGAEGTRKEAAEKSKKSFEALQEAEKKFSEERSKAAYKEMELAQKDHRHSLKDYNEAVTKEATATRVAATYDLGVIGEKQRVEGIKKERIDEQIKELEKTRERAGITETATIDKAIETLRDQQKPSKPLFQDRNDRTLDEITKDLTAERNSAAEKEGKGWTENSMLDRWREFAGQNNERKYGTSTQFTAIDKMVGNMTSNPELAGLYYATAPSWVKAQYVEQTTPFIPTSGDGRLSNLITKVVLGCERDLNKVADTNSQIVNIENVQTPNVEKLLEAGWQRSYVEKKALDVENAIDYKTQEMIRANEEENRRARERDRLDRLLEIAKPQSQEKLEINERIEQGRQYFAEQKIEIQKARETYEQLADEGEKKVKELSKELKELEKYNPLSDDASTVRGELANERVQLAFNKLLAYDREQEVKTLDGRLVTLGKISESEKEREKFIELVTSQGETEKQNALASIVEQQNNIERIADNIAELHGSREKVRQDLYKVDYEIRKRVEFQQAEEAAYHMQMAQDSNKMINELTSRITELEAQKSEPKLRDRELIERELTNLNSRLAEAEFINSNSLGQWNAVPEGGRKLAEDRSALVESQKAKVLAQNESKRENGFDPNTIDIVASTMPGMEGQMTTITKLSQAMLPSGELEKLLEDPSTRFELERAHATGKFSESESVMNMRAKIRNSELYESSGGFTEKEEEKLVGILRETYGITGIASDLSAVSSSKALSKEQIAKAEGLADRLDTIAGLDWIRKSDAEALTKASGVLRKAGEGDSLEDNKELKKASGIMDSLSPVENVKDALKKFVESGVPSIEMLSQTARDEYNAALEPLAKALDARIVELHTEIRNSAGEEGAKAFDRVVATTDERMRFERMQTAINSGSFSGVRQAAIAYALAYESSSSKEKDEINNAVGIIKRWSTDTELSTKQMEALIILDAATGIKDFANLANLTRRAPLAPEQVESKIIELNIPGARQEYKYKTGITYTPEEKEKLDSALKQARDGAFADLRQKRDELIAPLETLLIKISETKMQEVQVTLGLAANMRAGLPFELSKEEEQLATSLFEKAIGRDQAKEKVARISKYLAKDDDKLRPAELKEKKALLAHVEKEANKAMKGLRKSVKDLIKKKKDALNLQFEVRRELNGGRITGGLPLDLDTRGKWIEDGITKMRAELASAVKELANANAGLNKKKQELESSGIKPGTGKYNAGIKDAIDEVSRAKSKVWRLARDVELFEFDLYKTQREYEYRLHMARDDQGFAHQDTLKRQKYILSQFPDFEERYSSMEKMRNRLYEDYTSKASLLGHYVQSREMAKMTAWSSLFRSPIETRAWMKLKASPSEARNAKIAKWALPGAAIMLLVAAPAVAITASVATIAAPMTAPLLSGGLFISAGILGASSLTLAAYRRRRIISDKKKYGKSFNSHARIAGEANLLTSRGSGTNFNVLPLEKGKGSREYFRDAFVIKEGPEKGTVVNLPMSSSLYINDYASNWYHKPGKWVLEAFGLPLSSKLRRWRSQVLLGKSAYIKEFKESSYYPLHRDPEYITAQQAWTPIVTHQWHLPFRFADNPSVSRMLGRYYDLEQRASGAMYGHGIWAFEAGQKARGRYYVPHMDEPVSAAEAVLNAFQTDLSLTGYARKKPDVPPDFIDVLTERITAGESTKEATNRENALKEILRAMEAELAKLKKGTPEYDAQKERVESFRKSYEALALPELGRLADATPEELAKARENASAQLAVLLNDSSAKLGELKKEATVENLVAFRASFELAAAQIANIQQYDAWLERKTADPKETESRSAQQSLAEKQLISLFNEAYKIGSATGNMDEQTGKLTATMLNSLVKRRATLERLESSLSGTLDSLGFAQKEKDHKLEEIRRAIIGLEQVDSNSAALESHGQRAKNIALSSISDKLKEYGIIPPESPEDKTKHASLIAQRDQIARGIEEFVEYSLKKEVGRPALSDSGKARLDELESRSAELLEYGKHFKSFKKEFDSTVRKITSKKAGLSPQDIDALDSKIAEQISHHHPGDNGYIRMKLLEEADKAILTGVFAYTTGEGKELLVPGWELKVRDFFELKSEEIALRDGVTSDIETRGALIGKKGEDGLVHYSRSGSPIAEIERYAASVIVEDSAANVLYQGCGYGRAGVSFEEKRMVNGEEITRTSTIFIDEIGKPTGFAVREGDKGLQARLEEGKLVITHAWNGTAKMESVKGEEHYSNDKYKKGMRLGEGTDRHAEAKRAIDSAKRLLKSTLEGLNTPEIEASAIESKKVHETIAQDSTTVIAHGKAPAINLLGEVTGLSDTRYRVLNPKNRAKIPVTTDLMEITDAEIRSEFEKIKHEIDKEPATYRKWLLFKKEVRSEVEKPFKMASYNMQFKDLLGKLKSEGSMGQGEYVALAAINMLINGEYATLDALLQSQGFSSEPMMERSCITSVTRTGDKLTIAEKHAINSDVNRYIKKQASNSAAVAARDFGFRLRAEFDKQVPALESELAGELTQRGARKGRETKDEVAKAITDRRLLEDKRIDSIVAAAEKDLARQLYAQGIAIALGANLNDPSKASPEALSKIEDRINRTGLALVSIMNAKLYENLDAKQIQASNLYGAVSRELEDVRREIRNIIESKRVSGQEATKVTGKLTDSEAASVREENAKLIAKFEKGTKSINEQLEQMEAKAASSTMAGMKQDIDSINGLISENDKLLVEIIRNKNALDKYEESIGYQETQVKLLEKADQLISSIPNRREAPSPPPSPPAAPELAVKPAVEETPKQPPAVAPMAPPSISTRAEKKEAKPAEPKVDDRQAKLDAALGDIPFTSESAARIEDIMNAFYSPRMAVEAIDKWKNTARMLAPGEAEPSDFAKLEKTINEINRVSTFGEVKVEAVGRAEALDVMSRAEIHAHEFMGENLTTEYLEQQGLAPARKITMGDVTVWFSSNPYKLEEGRAAVVAYVQNEEGEITARSYYLSNSQAVWRYLPSYLPTQDRDGKTIGIDWYSKGHSEQSITLPSEMQQVLAEMTKPGTKLLDVENPNLVFAGTARDIYRIAEERRNITFIAEVGEIPTRPKGNFYASKPGELVPPEKMIFEDPGDNPDYTKKVGGWPQQTPKYGMVEVEVFESANGKLKFMISRDSKGRAWPGGVENDSPLTSLGLRSTWVDVGCLTTPAFEYESQSGGYGDPSIRSGNYVDMFNNYISKIPIIQEYLKYKAERGE